MQADADAKGRVNIVHHITGVYPLPGKPPVHDESLLTRSR
jgi:hypothetical protein